MDMNNLWGYGQLINAAEDNPELYSQIQSDRNRQMIAQMLMQQGQAQPQGQMVGRFYVPPSPFQHGANALSMLAGLYGMNKSNEMLGESMKAHSRKKIADRNDFMDQYVKDTEAQHVPEHALPQMPVEGPPSPDGQLPSGAVGGFEGPVNPEMTIEPDPAMKRKRIVEGLLHNDPKVSSAVQFLERQRQAEALKKEELAYRRDSTASMEATRLAQLKQNLILTQMQIDDRQRRGEKTDDLQRDLADMKAESDKLQRQTQASIAKGHDATQLAIAGMKSAQESGKIDKKQEERIAGQQQVQELAAQLKSYHDDLLKGGGQTSIENSSLANIGASISGSGPGQVVGRILGTKNQDARNKIAMTRPLLMSSIMRATGMSAKQLDSNVELKLWLSTATDPDMGYDANMEALKNIQKFMDNAAPQNASQTTGSSDAATPAMNMPMSGVAPRTATGKNGEKLILKDGKWQPLKK